MNDFTETGEDGMKFCYDGCDGNETERGRVWMEIKSAGTSGVAISLSPCTVCRLRVYARHLSIYLYLFHNKPYSTAKRKNSITAGLQCCNWYWSDTKFNTRWFALATLQFSLKYYCW